MLRVLKFVALVIVITALIGYRVSLMWNRFGGFEYIVLHISYAQEEDEEFSDEDLSDLEEDSGDFEEESENEGIESTGEDEVLEEGEESVSEDEEVNKWKVQPRPIDINSLGKAPDYMKNPFKPTIKKKKPQPITPQIEEEPKVEEIPPLPLKLLGVNISEDFKIAIIEFNGKIYELEEGQGVPGLFQVTSITDNKVVVYDERRNANQILSFEE